MNRLLGWLLVVCLGAALAGCGGNGDAEKIKICLVKNRNADISDKAFDEAVKKANETFKGSGVEFELAETSQIDDATVPDTPSHKGHTGRTDDQKKIIDAAKKKAKKECKLLVVVVSNFALSEEFGKINGVTDVGTGPVLIADPSGIEANTMRRNDFSRTLAHELGHAFGLTHKKLKSDLGEGEKEGEAEYKAPNLMSGDGEKDATTLTEDQKKAIADGSKKYK